jgi:hypothetical protein
MRRGDLLVRGEEIFSKFAKAKLMRFYFADPSSHRNNFMTISNFSAQRKCFVPKLAVINNDPQ